MATKAPADEVPDLKKKKNKAETAKQSDDRPANGVVFHDDNCVPELFFGTKKKIAPSGFSRIIEGSLLDVSVTGSPFVSLCDTDREGGMLD